LCGNKAQIVEQNYPGYKEPDRFSICNCSFCNTQFSYPRVETAQLYEFIYQHADIVPGYDRYYKYKNVVKSIKHPLKYLSDCEEAYWAINDALKYDSKNKDKLKILEVGCGMGYLTYSIHEEGFNILGLDISHGAIEEAINNFGEYYICTDVFSYSSEHKEEYDRIILTQVIEHVEDPVKWMRALSFMLKKGGKIIVTTENKTIFPNDVIWQSDLPPVHLWWFSEQSMQYIADQIGAALYFTNFSKYNTDVMGRFISPIDYNQHRIFKDGRIQVIENSQSKLRNIIKSIPFAKYIYRKYINPFDIIFDKRRFTMGAIFIK
jgi:2-polyprenyl-3-methyl-5-hydroxy-6-metoxy-1,4-benzoquinol methylase